MHVCVRCCGLTHAPEQGQGGSGKQLARSKRGDVPDTGGVTISLADFRCGAASFAGRDDVDVSQLEAYLNESDFVAVFGMKKAKFYEVLSRRFLCVFLPRLTGAAVSQLATLAD